MLDGTFILIAERNDDRRCGGADIDAADFAAADGGKADADFRRAERMPEMRAHDRRQMQLELVAIAPRQR